MSYSRPVARNVSGGSTDEGGSAEGPYTYWDIDCPDKRVRVFIHGGGRDMLEIPTTFVQAHESTEGPASTNQMTEVRFPAEWEHRDVVSHIDAFDPDTQQGYDRVLIQFQDVQSSEWYDYQYGYVRSVGGADTTGVMKFWVADPSSITTAISYGARYTGSTYFTYVIEDILNRFANESVFSNVQLLDPDDVIEDVDVGDANATGLVRSTDVSGGDEAVTVNKTFKSNQYTVADAFNWVAKVTDSDWWFDYVDDTLSLVFGERNTRVFRSTEVEPSNTRLAGGGDPIDIITNTALHDLSPINEISVMGVEGRSILGHNIKELSGEYPTATAQYPPLIQRAGQSIPGKTQNVDANTVDEAKNIARTRLKETILDSGNGDITVKGHPGIRINDVIWAIPECRDQYIDNGVAFQWEVTDITHTKKATEEFLTELKVGPQVNESLIEITESGMQDATQT